MRCTHLWPWSFQISRNETQRQTADAAGGSSIRLKFLDESWQKNLLGKERANASRHLAADRAGFAPDRLNLLDYPVNLAMTSRGPRVLITESLQDFRQVAGPWTDMENRGGDTEDIVNLARMHQSHEGVAHNHHMKVRRRQRSGQLIQRLVRKADDLGSGARREGRGARAFGC